MVSAWELQKAFNEAQSKGGIPLEEDFDPIFLWHAGNTVEERHPHWIALRARLEIRKLHKQGRVSSHGTSGVTFNGEGVYRGLEWVDVPNGRVIFVQAAMREQQFPLYLGDLFSELMTVLLFDRLQHLQTGNGAASPEEVERALQEYSGRYSMGGFHSCGESSVQAKFIWKPGEQRMILKTSLGDG